MQRNALNGSYLGHILSFLTVSEPKINLHLLDFGRYIFF